MCSTSYFQLLSMVEDLPVQLDHILYRHHFYAPATAILKTISEKKPKTTFTKPSNFVNGGSGGEAADTSGGIHHSRPLSIAVEDSADASGPSSPANGNTTRANVSKKNSPPCARKSRLVMRMVPFFFNQPDSTVAEVVKEVSPLHTASQDASSASPSANNGNDALSPDSIAAGRAEGVVMRFHTEGSNNAMPLSDHWGVACRFVLAPLDPYAYHTNDSSSSTQSVSSTPPPPLSAASAKQTRRMMLEAFSAPRPHQFVSKVDSKVFSSALETFEITLSAARKANDLKTIAVLEQQAVVVAQKMMGVYRDADDADSTNDDKGTGDAERFLSRRFDESLPFEVRRQHTTAMVDDAIERVMANPQTFSHRNNGPDLFYHCSERHRIITTMFGPLCVKKGFYARSANSSARIRK